MPMFLFDEEIKFIATDCYCTYIFKISKCSHTIYISSVVFTILNLRDKTCRY